MWYDVAPGDAVHDTLIELDDTAVAVNPVGVDGGASFVIADIGGLDSTDSPLVFDALTS